MYIGASYKGPCRKYREPAKKIYFGQLEVGLDGRRHPGIFSLSSGV